MQNVHTFINYSTLGADVAAWQAAYVEDIRGQFGEEAAAETERELMADPWKALRWFVEDRRGRQPGAIAA